MALKFGKKAKETAPVETQAPVSIEESGGDPFALDAAPADEGQLNGASNGKAARRAAKTPKAKSAKSGVVVGLNIGNSLIKAVEVSSKGGELTVTAMGAVPTPPESLSNGVVMSVGALSGAIKDLWRQAGIKGKNVVSSVAGTGALVVRVIEVPKMTDSELKDNMKVDADRYIPFPPSEVVMDFVALRDLPSDPDAPNMEVLLAAAQREIIDLHIKVVQSAKLEPRAIDVEPIAATRALQIHAPGEANVVDYNEVTGLINLGATGTEISVLRGDIVVFTRTVPTGGNMLTQAIADTLGLPFYDAERIKIEQADALPPHDMPLAATADAGEWEDFGLGDGEAGQAPAEFTETTQARTADDPFDLDFFNQGPQQDEPGAGHGQKEGEPAKDNFDFGNFSFGDEEKPAPTPPVEPEPAEADEATMNLGDFAFGNIPATTDAPAAQPQPSAQAAAPNEFDLENDDLLPAMSGEPDADDAEAPTMAFSFNEVEGGNDEELPSVATPEASAPTEAVAPASAFEFSNFDLPAIAEAQDATPPAAQTQAAPAAPEPDAAPTFALSLDKEEAPEPAPQADSAFDEATFAILDEPATAPQAPAPTQAAPAAGDEFNLDDIFGGAPAQPQAADAPVAPAAMQPAVSAGDANDAFDVDDLMGAGFDAPSQAAPDEFDLGAIGGFGGTDDMTSFGAGLVESEAGATDAATLYTILHPILEELSNEVRRSLEYHLSRYPDASISRLTLIGGGAGLLNLDVFFTQMMGIPTAVGNPFTKIPVRAPKLPPDYVTDNGAICAVALGLAVRDFV